MSLVGDCPSGEINRSITAVSPPIFHQYVLQGFQGGYLLYMVPWVQFILQQNPSRQSTISKFLQKSDLDGIACGFGLKHGFLTCKRIDSLPRALIARLRLTSIS